MSQLPQDVEEFIAGNSQTDHIRDEYGDTHYKIDVVDVDDLRAWMTGHVRVPATKFQLGETVWVNLGPGYLIDNTYDRVRECRISQVITSSCVNEFDENRSSESYQVVILDDVYENSLNIETTRIHRNKESAIAANANSLEEDVRRLRERLSDAIDALNASKGE